jgi:hypothetical protein
MLGKWWRRAEQSGHTTIPGGVVDQDVEAAVLGHDVVDCGADLRFAGLVHLIRQTYGHQTLFSHNDRLVIPASWTQTASPCKRLPSPAPSPSALWLSPPRRLR